MQQKKSVVGYCRVSTLEQKKKGYGIAIQMREIERYARERGWQIVAWYKLRWTIEQLFRTLKKQGLRLEDSQVETAGRLLKLTAIATHAAALIMQLVQARDGQRSPPASIAFSDDEIDALQAIEASKYAPRTERQRNPHPTRSLAWAAWIVARLGGWDGYSSSRPPGPITFKHGLDYFKGIATGWALRNV